MKICRQLHQIAKVSAKEVSRGMEASSGKTIAGEFTVCLFLLFLLLLFKVSFISVLCVLLLRIVNILISAFLGLPKICKEKNLKSLNFQLYIADPGGWVWSLLGFILSSTIMLCGYLIWCCLENCCPLYWSVKMWVTPNLQVLWNSLKCLGLVDNEQ